MNVKNIVKSAIFGSAVGDALGVPVEFLARNIVAQKPVVTMKAGQQTIGCWSDDTSMTLATLVSLTNSGYSLDAMMYQFLQWCYEDKYTATGEVFDIGVTTKQALRKYKESYNVLTCGSQRECDNGNGALMRIMPICLYEIFRRHHINTAVQRVEIVGSLTHATVVSNIGCGIYYFIVRELLKSQHIEKAAIVQYAMFQASFYYQNVCPLGQIAVYSRLFDIYEFMNLDSSEIESTGYVVHTLEAAVWCFLTTDTYSDCVLKAVNLGDDADTVASVAGGLAGLYYGIDEIPDVWLMQLLKTDDIGKICDAFANAL